MQLAKIVQIVCLFFFITSCQEASLPQEQHYPYPSIALKPMTPDTIAGQLITFPSAGFDGLAPAELNVWIKEQTNFTKEQLLSQNKLPYSSLLATRAFHSFPVAFNQQYYAIIQSNRGARDLPK